MVGAFDVFPSDAPPDEANELSRYAVLGGDILLRSTAEFQVANLDDLRLAQFREWMAASLAMRSMPDLIHLVLRVGSPSEIVESIIPGVSIPVQDFLVWPGRSSKGFENQGVNHRVPPCSVSPVKDYTHVPVLAGIGAHVFPIAILDDVEFMLRTTAFPRASHAPEIRDLISRPPRNVLENLNPDSLVIVDHDLSPNWPSVHRQSRV